MLHGSSPRAHASDCQLPGPITSEILEKLPRPAFDYSRHLPYKHFTLLGTLIIFAEKCDGFIAGAFFIYTSTRVGLHLFDNILLITLNHVTPIVVPHYFFH